MLNHHVRLLDLFSNNVYTRFCSHKPGGSAASSPSFLLRSFPVEYRPGTRGGAVGVSLHGLEPMKCLAHGRFAAEAGFAVVAVQDGELGAVDRAQLVGGEVQAECYERVDFDEGLAAVLGFTVRGVPGPRGSHDVVPEVGVGIGDAVEAKDTLD